MQLMKNSDASPSDFVKRSMAIHSTFQVWAYFMEDLASPENQNSDVLKARLISIGIFVLSHLDKMRKDHGLNFAPVMEISETIQGGLN